MSILLPFLAFLNPPFHSWQVEHAMSEAGRRQWNSLAVAQAVAAQMQQMAARLECGTRSGQTATAEQTGKVAPNFEKAAGYHQRRLQLGAGLEERGMYVEVVCGTDTLSFLLAVQQRTGGLPSHKTPLLPICRS